VKYRRFLGMSLPELLVSTTIFGLVVVGSTGSALLLAKIAADHENRADFSTDTRAGMEQIAFDVRNADSILSRNNQSFVLGDAGGNITYLFLPNDKKVVRWQSGTPQRDIFTKVANFDVLISAADAPNGMTFRADEIGIEKLEFESGNGTGKATNRTIEAFTIRARNL
jgi:hypothetical protein